jgi:hypothetical protein
MTDLDVAPHCRGGLLAFAGIATGHDDVRIGSSQFRCDLCAKPAIRSCDDVSSPALIGYVRGREFTHPPRLGEPPPRVDGGVQAQSGERD